MATVIINGISYTNTNSSNARLITKLVEGQTALPESQELLDQRSYNLSERNGANAYIIPTDQEKVYLNFIAQKVSVWDQDLNELIQPRFEYFTEEIIPGVDPFVLADGIIYRCVDENSLPKNKEDYTYYIMMNGVARTIPNYKSLEVMLAERGQNLLSVRVIEKAQCQEIPKDSTSLGDKSGAWKQDYADMTSLETLKEMNNKAKEAAAIVEEAKASADKQIATVKAQAEAAKAGEEAAKAEAEAAKAASEQAIAEANAAQAEAEAAKAEAEAQKTENGE